MGARVVRMFRNFNLENRVHREISREKPLPAPRHAAAPRPPPPPPPPLKVTETVNQKNDPLLALLRTVYVQSTDPAAAAEASKDVPVAERRPLKFSLPVAPYGMVELTDVPKGKLTIAEALKALGGHQQQPQTWTPEKIAQDYSLDLKDTKDLLEFFIPFEVKIIPPKTENAKQINSS
ncbi:NADH dehydrogenase [ubiquinone] 1 alpha subcomplex assembly factor 4 [Dicentrarchus labrax]|uniref:NADH dehydrogenase [ubiquinone] 1 alpha subcomplex assembly factor 4 n=1 Tax=Dicentrarchus labrax TaxID=13489 RepID=UPI0021F54C1B|nr:NADH dehydrogenase [ubiquinone] 1 alpha subcomplex assembly factor 4 [Dicentrarchus labrax]